MKKSRIKYRMTKLVSFRKYFIELKKDRKHGGLLKLARMWAQRKRRQETGKKAYF